MLLWYHHGNHWETEGQPISLKGNSEMIEHFLSNCDVHLIHWGAHCNADSLGLHCSPGL